MESIGGYICPRPRDNRLVSAALFQMPAESPWNRCGSSNKLLCSEAPDRARLMLCSVSRPSKVKISTRCSAFIHLPMILATKKHYIVPCTVPYLFVIHDNNLIICLCVFHSETEIKTASLKSDWGEASHRCNSEFSCLLTVLSLNSSHVYRNQDQHLDNWAASFELVREW